MEGCTTLTQSLERSGKHGFLRRKCPQIQFVSATLVLGWLVLDISLPSSRYQASLGVSQSGTFMGGVVDLLDDGLQVGVRQAVETGPLGQVAADPCMCSIGS